MKVIQMIDDKIFMVTDKYSKPEGLEHIDKMNETDGEYFYRLATFKEYKQLLDKNCLKDFEFYRIRENIGHGGIIRADLSISSLMLIVKELKDKNMNDRYKITNGSIIITKPKRIDLTIDEAKELLGVLPTVIEEYENDSKQVRMAAIIETIKGLNKHIEELKEELVSLK